jgi:signal transduction histidine kinase
MAMDSLANVAGTATARVRSWHERWFAGLTKKGGALVVLICVINGTRREIQGFAETPLLEWLGRTAQTSALGLLIAIPVVVAVVVTYNLAPRRPWLTYPLLALAVAASSLAGVVAHDVGQAALFGSSSVEPGESWTSAILRSWVRYGSLCALFSAVFAYLRAADESTGRALEAERGRARFVQRMEEARLRMLQAQIEPHFLFNTLANVRRLYQTDAAAAESMLENLMRYLEVALPQMRASGSTLGREAALTEAYLALQQVRMGRRLAFEFDVPAPLRDAPLPPMMLLTLVENAIKHGLAPLPEGGSVRVSAAVDGSELQVRVADTGRGFAQTSGGGTGLANIRARLSGTYGPAGRLTLSLNVPHGVVATIAVPHSSSVAAVPAS